MSLEGDIVWLLLPQSIFESIFNGMCTLYIKWKQEYAS